MGEQGDYKPKFIKELSSYYMTFDKESVDYIKNNFYIPTLDDCERMLQWIQERHQKNFGFPDIELLGKCKAENGVKKTTRLFFANVCEKCGTTYGFRMTACPTCYTRGYVVSDHRVKQSEMPIDQIRYNKEAYGFVTEDEKGIGNCYRCEFRHDSWCEHYGDKKWVCRSSEFDKCYCRKCCAEEKRANAALEKRMQNEKLSDAGYNGYEKVVV